MNRLLGIKKVKTTTKKERGYILYQGAYIIVIKKAIILYLILKSMVNILQAVKLGWAHMAIPRPRLLMFGAIYYYIVMVTRDILTRSSMSISTKDFYLYAK